jgi:glycosyltransferase involved in cell wall biosynthesis
MGQAGRRRIERHFTWEAKARALAAILTGGPSPIQ